MKYLLSRLVPMPFVSTYTVNDAGRRHRERCVWVQWRDRVLWSHVTPLGGTLHVAG